MAGSVSSTPVNHASGYRDIKEMFALFKKQKNQKNPNTNPKSYAEATTPSSVIPPVSDAAITDDGEYKSVKINQKAFEKRVQMCSFSLIGRLNLNKGEAPWKLEDLRSILSKTWGIATPWRLISLGKGFYHLLLPSEKSRQLIRSRGVISLKPGTFRVQPWSPDFDPNSQKTTNAQVWVRLYNLPWVYWDPIILSDIARCLGGLIRIDRATLDGDYGHFARLLLDVDMAGKLQTQVGIERDGKKIWLQVVYEDLPKFCKQCSTIGHMAYQCKKASDDEKANNTNVVSIVSKYKRTLNKPQQLPNQSKSVSDKSGKEKTNATRLKQPEVATVWKQVQNKKHVDISVSDIHKKINSDLATPERVRDGFSGEYVTVEDASLSSSDYDSEYEEDLSFNGGDSMIVPWINNRIIKPVSVVFPDSPTQTQNPFELLSGLEENADDTVKITEITSNDVVSPKKISWADQFGSDSEPEKINTEIINHSWRSNRHIQFAEQNHDVNSDPEGLYTVYRRKKKYNPTPQIEPQVQVSSKATRGYFPVGTRKSNRQGILSDGTEVAVKQLSSKSKQGNREFVNEIGLISASQHPNLVRLFGCCVEGSQLLLVYEYMENNSLAYNLFGERDGHMIVLNWPTRHKICVGIARGLAFLHEESAIKIVHRDIKATNVLLDKDLNAKISDFGLAKLDHEENTHISTRVAGTIGYMAPEYALWGHLTYKADVYSFGVVALEIVAGKSNMKRIPDKNSVCLVDLALVLKQEENLMELVDPRLESNFNEEEVSRVIEIALLCTNPSAELRPTMSSVISMLEGKVEIYEQETDTSFSGNEFRSTAIKKQYDQMLMQNISSETRSIAHSSDAIWEASSSTSGHQDLYPFNTDSTLA